MKRISFFLMLAVGLSAPASAMERDLAISLAKITAASVGGQVYTVADTGSMEPTLNRNSIVVSEPTDITKIQTGDIVVFRNASQTPVIHRVVKADPEGLVVKGDANAKPDSNRVTQHMLIGKVCASF